MRRILQAKYLFPFFIGAYCTSIFGETILKDAVAERLRVSTKKEALSDIKVRRQWNSSYLFGFQSEIQTKETSSLSTPLLNITAGAVLGYANESQIARHLSLSFSYLFYYSRARAEIVPEAGAGKKGYFSGIDVIPSIRARLVDSPFQFRWNGFLGIGTTLGGTLLGLNGSKEFLSTFGPYLELGLENRVEDRIYRLILAQESRNLSSSTLLEGEGVGGRHFRFTLSVSVLEIAEDAFKRKIKSRQ